MKQNKSTAWAASSPERIQSSPGLDRPKPAGAWASRARQSFLFKARRFDALYMPFSMFEDCNVGNKQRQLEAFYRNKERKGAIFPFIAAWSLRGLAMAAGLSTAENIQRLGMDTTYLQAGFAIGLSLCVVFCAVMWIGWLGLTFFKE